MNTDNKDFLYSAHLLVAYEDFGPDDMMNFFGEQMNDDVSHVEQMEVGDLDGELYRIEFEIGVDVQHDDGAWDMDLFNCVTYGTVEIDSNGERFYKIERLDDIVPFADDLINSPHLDDELFGSGGLAGSLFREMLGGGGRPSPISMFSGLDIPDQLIDNLRITEEIPDNPNDKKFIIEFETDEEIDSSDIETALKMYF